MEARIRTPVPWARTFGVFEVDLRSGELRKDGVPVPLQGLPFRLLTTLLERPGEVMSRDELRARLWPAGTFVDFEHGLNAAVRRLRRALDDSAEAPIFVETLQRRGYRFIPTSGTADSRTDVVPPGSGQRTRLAVLPFQVMTQPARAVPFSEGLLAETMTQLVRLCTPTIAIVARSAVERFRQSPDPVDIHRALGVHYVLEGNLRFSPERVRITAQLIDCADAAHVWADVFEQAYGTDTFAAEQETALLMARAVSGRLLASS